MSDFIRQIRISGRVQGVGYRAFVVTTALELGLRGWVRNRRDGSVEAVLAGPAATVAEMLARCRRGPSAARVDDVAEVQAGPEALRLQRPGELFSVLPTL